MRAVITGGAGFLGSHLCELLLSKDWEVLCLDNLVTGSDSNISHLLPHPKFRFARQDVSRYIEVAGPVEVVLHFASPASPPDYLKYPIQTLKVGALGTHNSLGLAMAKKARYLLASTSECYGDPQVSPQPESYWGHVNPVGPRGVYDESKRYAEAMTMAYHRYHGLDTRIVRIFNTYGPRMRLNDGRALPNFLYQALVGEPITVYGDGSRPAVSASSPICSRASTNCSNRTSTSPRISATRRKSPSWNLPNASANWWAQKRRSSSIRCRKTIPNSAARTSLKPSAC